MAQLNFVYCMLMKLVGLKVDLKVNIKN